MRNDLTFSRREFVKTVTLLTASSAALGGRWLGTVVAQMSPGGGVLRLKISDFPPLQNDNGSVRIGTSANTRPVGGIPNCFGPVGLFYPTIVNRGPGGQFFAMSAECPHAQCTVQKYNASTGFMQCPGHGSRFEIDGSFIIGPANGPMISFSTRLEGTDTLLIENPDWNFNLTTEGVVPGNPGRFALRFVAFEGLEYEVQFREAVEDIWTVVAFSLTPGGAANQTVFVPPQFGGPATLYVDRVAPAGFYSIAMRIREV